MRKGAITVRPTRRSKLSTIMALPLHRRTISFVQKAYSHDPHERIDSIGGLNSDKSRWKLSQEAAIAAIESGKAEFFVKANDRNVRVLVFTHGGKKYLKAEHDDKDSDILLALPLS